MTPEPVCWPRSAQSVIARSTKESTVSLGSASWISHRPEPGWVRPSWSAWCQPRSVTSCCWVCAASPLELAASPAWQPELMLRTDAALEAFARLAAGSQATSWWRRSLRRPWVRGACTRRPVEYRTGSRAVLAHRAGGAARPGPRGDGLFGVRLRQPRWWCRVSNGRSCVALAESMHRDRRRSADRIP